MACLPFSPKFLRIAIQLYDQSFWITKTSLGMCHADTRFKEANMVVLCVNHLNEIYSSWRVYM